MVLYKMYLVLHKRTHFDELFRTEHILLLILRKLKDISN